jgi:GntR family transcriptional regulator/MocR family aminotransferase
MVLPRDLMGQFRQRLGFYSSTVSGFEQHTLARFLQEGHFEKHINRMRKFYKARRNRLLELLKNCPWADKIAIQEADAGLHFLVKVDTGLSDEDLVDFCKKMGLTVRSLSSYYHDAVPENARHTLVINYSGLTDGDALTLEQLLATKDTTE